MLGDRQRGARGLGAGRDRRDDADWYDYEAKYEPGGMELVVPARIPEDARERVRELALETFRALGCAGMARVDFFVEDPRARRGCS